MVDQNTAENLKDALYAITGRSALPEFTHDFVNQIAYMMKQRCSMTLMIRKCIMVKQ